MAKIGVIIMPGNKDAYINMLRKREAAAEQELASVRAQIASFAESTSKKKE